MVTAPIYSFVGGFAPSPSAYDAAKAASRTLRATPNLASHGINVFGVVPGFFRTNIDGGLLLNLENELTWQSVAEIERRTPCGRMGDVKYL